MFRSLLFTGLVLAGFAASAFSSQKFECFIISSPEKLLTGVKKIAIIDFEGAGNKGRAMADYMTAQLLLEDRGISNVGGGFFTAAQKGKTYQKGARTNVYDLIERSQLDKVLQEQKLSNTGMINEQQAAQIGKILGLDAIITGNISIGSVDENSQNQYSRQNGSTYMVYCTTRKVTVKARMKIVSVNTAQIIGTKDTSYVNKDYKCDEQRSGLMTPDDLADPCLKQMAVDFVDYFTPGFRHAKYEFADIKGRQFRDRAREAEDYVKKGELDNAFAIYKAIYDADQYNVDAIDAVGGLYDIVGNFPKALEYAKINAEIDSKKYQAFADYVEKEIEMQKTLVSLGITIEPKDFSSKSDVLAKKVTTKGDRDDRLDVKAQPDNGSETVAKVPGKMEFAVLEEKGDWIKIKLVGGKEGYLNKKDVR